MKFVKCRRYYTLHTGIGSKVCTVAYITSVHDALEYTHARRHLAPHRNHTLEGANKNTRKGRERCTNCTSYEISLSLLHSATVKQKCNSIFIVERLASWLDPETVT